jgi:DNA-binding NtrC family response regulator
VYVDDERGNRIVFEQSLSSEFNLRTAQSAAEVLDLLAKHEVAVVISDMRMPSMTGEELLRIVKERHPQVIRMVVTAYADVEPILRAINEGLVARYIVKPWIRAELVQVLRWAIEAWAFSRDSAALHRRLLETERLATLGSIASMLAPPAARDRAARHAGQHREHAGPRSQAAADVAPGQRRAPARARDRRAGTARCPAPGADPDRAARPAARAGR